MRSGNKRRRVIHSYDDEGKFPWEKVLELVFKAILYTIGVVLLIILASMELGVIWFTVSHAFK